MSASALYEGSVRHRRFAERRHEFSYPVRLAYLDLDELPALLGGRLLARRPGLVRFRRRDYLGDPRVPLGDAVRDAVEERTGARPSGPIRLLTQLRSLGHCFNPVSFYFCVEPRGDRLEAVLAEVTNTPWGERHAYAIAGDGGPVVSGSSEKAMHVSPFLTMDQRYEWRVSTPAETLSVHVESHRHEQLAFDATLNLRRRPLSARALAGAGARTVALIYGQALRLKLKGVSVYPHPRPAA